MPKQFNRTIASILIVAIVSGCATTATTATTTPQAASSKEWKLLVTTTDSTEIYVGNVSKLPNTQTAMAVLTNNKQPESIKLTNGATVITHSTVFDFEYDCNQRIWRQIMVSFWTERDEKGTKYVDAVPGKWTSVDENTGARKLYAEACKTTTVQAPSVPSTPEPTNYSGPTVGEVVEVVGTALGIAAIIGLAVLGAKNSSKSSSSSSKPASPPPVSPATHSIAPQASKIEPVQYKAPEIKSVKPAIPELETSKAFLYCGGKSVSGCILK